MNNLILMLNLLQTVIQNSLSFLLGLTILLFIILFFNQILGYKISLLGIYSRRLWGLPGIFFAPFIHLNFNHLFYNLIPLLVLTVLILPYGFEYYWNLTWILIIFSGSLTWLFGRSAIHIGASSLITAYWGFLLGQTLFGSLQIYHFFIAFICLYYFFGIFLGIFPTQDRVSWEGHLLGLISGLSLCFLSYHSLSIHRLLVPPFLIRCPAFICHR